MRSVLLSSFQYGARVARYAHMQQQQQQQLANAAVALATSTAYIGGSAHQCYSGNSPRSKCFDKVCTQNAPSYCMQWQWQYPSSGFALQFQRQFTTKNAPDRASKSETKASPTIDDADLLGESSKLGLFAKFKLMYKKYWYVLIPVHIVTSIGWVGGFYYMIRSGVDMVSLLEHMHVSESVIEKVQHSTMGHLALTYLCYKVATPFRYAVTLGGTTVSIKYLVQAGHIKPMPSKKEIMQMYEDKKAHRAALKAEKTLEKEKEKFKHQ